MLLLILVVEGDAREHPEGHREAAIDELLDVDVVDARVELHAPVVVEHGAAARGAIVGSRGEVASLDVEEGLGLG